MVLHHLSLHHWQLYQENSCMDVSWKIVKFSKKCLSGKFGGCPDKIVPNGYANQLQPQPQQQQQQP